MVRYRPPEDWQCWVNWLAAGLHARNRWRLALILLGMLFARGRRTVTTWLRAVGILHDFADDVKEIWRAGQQQVRNIWTNVAAFNLNLWMHTLVECWAWNKPVDAIRDRGDSPWDDPARRPSHADRRKALRRQTLLNEYSSLAPAHRRSTKIRALYERLLQLAA